MSEEHKPIVKAFSPESVQGKHRKFERFKKCPLSDCKCFGPEPYFDDEEGGMCKRCTLAEQAQETGMLLCECKDCGNLNPMKETPKTEKMIEEWRELHGNHKLLPLSKDGGPECDPKFEEARKRREIKRKHDLEQAEAAYQESLNRKKRSTDET